MNTERRRDALPGAERLVDQLLRQRLRAGQGAPPAGACLEPDTLAAWIEGSLGGEERAAAESHSAGCERCQAMLAAMVQTEPQVSPRRWWHSLTARWLVPVTAAATAAALWIAVAPDRFPRAPVPSSEADSAAARPASTPASVPPPAERAPETLADTSGRMERAKESPESKLVRTEGPKAAPAPSIVPSPVNAPPPPAAEERFAPQADRARAADDLRKAPETPRANAAVGRTEDVSARRDRAEAEAPVDSLQAVPKQAPASPASPPAPARSVAELNAPGGRSPLPAPAAAQAAAPPPAATQAFRSGVMGGVTSGVTSIDIVSPDPAIRWRTGANGLVQRSADGGVTWVTQESGTTLDLRAGSSPARDVCWLAGRGGAVLLSTDGKIWQKRPFPEAADLVAVSATNAKTATVTTSDGRRFSTTDGGATWSRPPLQE